jgi:hypothetical protein
MSERKVWVVRLLFMTAVASIGGGLVSEVVPLWVPFTVFAVCSFLGGLIIALDADRLGGLNNPLGVTPATFQEPRDFVLQRLPLAIGVLMICIVVLGALAWLVETLRAI